MLAGQKTFNGVAILLREASTPAAAEVQANLPNFEHEPKRLIAVTLDGLRIVDGCLPNGQAAAGPP